MSTSISKLPELPNCVSLSCYGCPLLNNLPDLPNVIELDCASCSLKKLPNLPNCTILDCSSNKLLYLPNLPKVVDLNCSANNITTVGKINNVIKKLDISYNPEDDSYKLDCAKIQRDNPTIQELICDGVDKNLFKSVPQKYLNVAVPELTESQAKAQYESTMAKKEFIDYVNGVDIEDGKVLNNAIHVLYSALVDGDYQIYEVKELLTQNINLFKLELLVKGIIGLNQYKEFKSELNNLLVKIKSLRSEMEETKFSEAMSGFNVSMLPYISRRKDVAYARSVEDDSGKKKLVLTRPSLDVEEEKKLYYKNIKELNELQKYLQKSQPVNEDLLARLNRLRGIEERDINIEDIDENDLLMRLNRLREENDN